MKLNVRKKREEKGFTQEELSLKSGISRGSIILYENNSVDNITVKNLEALAKALDCTITDLFISEWSLVN